ncbi:hypothetical protein [Limosilactobacillus reuteri]|uniref:hypothetical protein n=1 Tax=Limosilactobacillus reuteri TaxID=1598 RepID=UPI001441B15A|nr:hypothetical protein [Limosilactobacillus reuteri]
MLRKMTLSTGTPQTIPELVQKLQWEQEVNRELDKINDKYLSKNNIIKASKTIDIKGYV